MEQESQVKVIPNDPEKPHPDLELTENGWAFIKKVTPLPMAMEFGVKIVKFFSPTRECPTHGHVKVVNRNFQPDRMNSVEGLSCGHTLLILRRVNGLKEAYVTLNKSMLDKPKNWKHAGWWLMFRETQTVT